jgi:hypothetical protein
VLCNLLFPCPYFMTFLGFLVLEDGTESFSRNFDTELPLHAA